MPEILVIDDEAQIARIIAHALESANHSVCCAHTLEQGRKLADQKQFEVVILDVVLPDGNGLASASEFMSLPSSPEVIIITGFAEHDGAQLALENGVFDYLQKPFGKNDVMLACTRALEFRVSRLKKQDVKLLACEAIIGKSTALKNSLDAVARVAISDHSILITGETGTGKELFAKAIHANSLLAKNNFVVVDCAALKSTLLESTLFGHEKGAFTGADYSHDGLVKAAHQGTLFLDEIGELTLQEQKKFLRLLEDKQYSPLGGKKILKSDFRLIAATNRNLEKMAEKGLFRTDLLYRIRGQQIHLPPLRERKGDIQELVYHYTEKTCKRISIENKKIYPDCLEALKRFDWPGNVRELINTLDESITGFPEDKYLQTRHLPTRIRVSIKDLETEKPSLNSFEETPGNKKKQSVPEEYMNSNQTSLDMFPAQVDNPEDFPQWKTFRRHAMEIAEKNYFKQLFSRKRGHVKDMACLSGITPARVYELIKKHGIG